MEQLLEKITITNVVILVVLSGLIYALFKLITDKNGTNIFHSIVDRKLILSELIIVFVGFFEALVGMNAFEQATNGEDNLAFLRFAMHFTLMLVSVIMGFSISKQFNEILQAITNNPEEVINEIIDFLISLFITVISAGFNWVMIAIGFGDAKFNKFHVIFNDTLSIWTVSSLFAFILHLLLIFYVTFSQRDKQALKNLRQNIFKKKEPPVIHNNSSNIVSDANVEQYLAKRFRISASALNQYFTHSTQGTTRKDIMKGLVKSAIRYRKEIQALTNNEDMTKSKTKLKLKILTSKLDAIHNNMKANLEKAGFGFDIEDEEE